MHNVIVSAKNTHEEKKSMFRHKKQRFLQNKLIIYENIPVLKIVHSTRSNKNEI